jgi:hypothetical protein
MCVHVSFFSRDSKFQAFVAERKESGVATNQNLQSLLIMPIQRIPRYVCVCVCVLYVRNSNHFTPTHELSVSLSRSHTHTLSHTHAHTHRYKLLLRELIGRTDQSHPDWGPLELAMSSISDVAKVSVLVYVYVNWCVCQRACQCVCLRVCEFISTCSIEV